MVSRFCPQRLSAHELHTRRDEAEKERKPVLDASEDLSLVNFRVVRLRWRIIPKPLCMRREAI